MAALHLALVGLLLAQQHAQERRLAAAVGTHDAHAPAARQAEAQVGKQRPVVGLGQAAYLKHHVAGAAHPAEVHLRRLDLLGALDAFESVEGFLARVGLLVELAVVDPADVLLLLLDVLLLSLVSLAFLLVALLAQPPVLLEVAGVGRQSAGAQLEDAGDDAVEEIAVVADDEHGLGLADEVILQPAGGVDVEVVAGLVQEHDVGRGEQQLGEHQPTLLASAEGLDGPVVIGGREAETVKHLLDVVIDVVGVVVAEQFVEAVVARREGAPLGLVGGAGQSLGGVDHVVVGGEQLVERTFGLFEEGSARGKVGLLAQKRDTGAGVQADVAVVGAVEAGEDAQQRRLADAVGPDEADALAGLQFEADVGEQGPFVETPREAGTAQQKHK